MGYVKKGGHGGPREGAGRPAVTKTMSPQAKAERRSRALTAPTAEASDARRIQERVRQSITSAVQASFAQAAGRRLIEQNPFKIPEFPRAAMPSDPKLAMDNNMLAWGSTQYAGQMLAVNASEGLVFLGYPFLSELAQRVEYRTISETIADDATRKWIDFEVTGDETEQAERKRRALNDPEGEAERMADPDERKKRIAAAGKTDKVKALKDDQLRLDVRTRFYEDIRNDGFFGRSHMFLDLGVEIGTNAQALKTPIGDGRTDVSKAQCPQGGFKGLRIVEPMWVYPLSYNANNPLTTDWYNPQFWNVMGTEVHCSRIPALISRAVPDMLKPAYAFGGLPLSQLAQPYIEIWLQTRESVAALIKSFSVMVLQTDMSTILQGGNAEQLMARIAMFNAFRDNQGTFVTNKSTEEFKNVAAPISGLHELQAQAQEHVASAARIPIVKYTGIQPAGLNADSEGVIKVYDDTIAAYQNRSVRPKLQTVVNFEQLSLFGEFDPEITFVFQPLREITEKERGEMQKQDAERDKIYVDTGVLAPEEVRKRIADDPQLPYANIDPDDVPDLAEEEAQGLEPGKGGGEPGGGGEGGGNEGGGANDAVPCRAEPSRSGHRQ